MHVLSLLLAAFIASAASATSTAQANSSASAAATTSTTTSKNLDVQYAILTIRNENALYEIETVINATENGAKQLMPKFTHVKIEIHNKIVSGQADPLWADTEIEHVKAVLDDTKPGFKAALDEYINDHPLNMYRLNNRTPEAIWDFTYAASVVSAKNVRYDVSPAKSEEILAKLEKLNDEFEIMFRSGVPPNITDMNLKINAFATEGTKIHKSFAMSVVNNGDLRDDEYRNEVTRLKKEAAANATKTEAPAVTAAPATATTLAPTVAPASAAATAVPYTTKATVALSVVSAAVSHFLVF